ncbi:MAG: peroxiredoxin family protein, partial [Candidatus Angelobacter sp.]
MPICVWLRAAAEREKSENMLQAESAGKLLTRDDYPAKGDVIRDFQLSGAEGQAVLLSEYRSRFNMVLAFCGASQSCAEFLNALGEHQQELAEKETRVLAIASGSRERASELKHSLRIDCQVLADVDLHLHRSMGATDPAGNIFPAIFITDRFGEVFAEYKVAQGKKLPEVKQTLEWLD